MLRVHVRAIHVRAIRACYVLGVSSWSVLRWTLLIPSPPTWWTQTAEWTSTTVWTNTTVFYLRMCWGAQIVLLCINILFKSVYVNIWPRWLLHHTEPSFLQVLLLRSLAGISLAIEVDVVPAVPVVALTTTNYEAFLFSMSSQFSSYVACIICSGTSLSSGDSFRNNQVSLTSSMEWPCRHGHCHHRHHLHHIAVGCWLSSCCWLQLFRSRLDRCRLLADDLERRRSATHWARCLIVSNRSALRLNIKNLLHQRWCHVRLLHHTCSQSGL